MMWRNWLRAGRWRFLPSRIAAGRFREREGKAGIIGPPPEGPAERAALASLYVALMTAVDLDLLRSAGDVIVDGSFADNRAFTEILAALRPQQSILMSKAKDGTALGAALLWGWPRTVSLDLEPEGMADIDGARSLRWCLAISNFELRRAGVSVKEGHGAEYGCGQILLAVILAEIDRDGTVAI